jgi:uncharacterized membrane protein YfcA
MAFDLTLTDTGLLFGAGAIGSALNAVAGGGTFFTFPAFLSTGVAAVVANTSNAVAIWPGRVLAIAAYRRELDRQRNRALWTGAVCLAGGLTGAWLLLSSGDKTFMHTVPWLMLAATLLFLFDKSISRRFGIRDSVERRSPLVMAVLTVPLFFCATYGGFFGGGLGVVMLPVLSMTGVKNIQELNGLKNLLVTVVTSVAVTTFVMSGIVSWPGTMTMMAGALIGGYGGGYLARQIATQVLRKIVIGFGFFLTAYYFTDIYLR